MEQTSSAKPIEVMMRYEFKYLLSPEQIPALLAGLRGRMEIDRYGETSIQSLYYDTPDFRLIRASVERPVFKEKLRLRSYGPATDSSSVFLELKRKFDGIVYKRRVMSTIPRVRQFLAGDDEVFEGGQINREITYFRNYYRELVPACVIIYERTAYFEPGGDLRLTIDRNPRRRMTGLDLTAPLTGEPLLPEGHAVLEVKIQHAVPLWLSAVLSGARIYKDSFSKYGTAYGMQVQAACRKDKDYV